MDGWLGGCRRKMRIGNGGALAAERGQAACPTCSPGVTSCLLSSPSGFPAHPAQTPSPSSKTFTTRRRGL